MSVRNIRFCGLEGLPGTGKTSTCRQVPPEHVAWQASSDVSPESIPPLLPDPSGRYRVSLDSIRAAITFFTAKDVSRTQETRSRGVPLIVLDRTWHSQIVHNFAVIRALDLPLAPLNELFHKLSTLVESGDLYFPDWLVMFRIPEKVSYRKVIRRDGRFFGSNMEAMLTVAERERFLRARAEGYRVLHSSRGIRIVTLSYQAHPSEKVAAVMKQPTDTCPTTPGIFFDDFWQKLIHSGWR